MLKISVITCTWNSAAKIKKCIESVRNQTYGNVEHVIVDGCSTDNTLETIKRYNPNAQIYSEPDKGIYDAFNKGIKLATGDVIGFLHSDDSFSSTTCLERIRDVFKENPNILYYCAKVGLVDPNTNRTVTILGKDKKDQTFLKKLITISHFAHPTYYCRKKVYEQVGKFDTAYKIAADTDWLIRLEKLRQEYFFDNFVLIEMANDGVSGRKIFTGLWEEFTAQIRHNGIRADLLFIYAVHFFRRVVKTGLKSLRMDFLIHWFRKGIAGK
jgi:glycosyltransferase involved in cell wall biosynthesis